ncbi:uncharacterized protein BDCG_17357 [Blastomyces dermatitidis ER-3]|uniref:ATP-dependent DNA helicase n=1 Tax=Ajellomyces dermatitidis (strain ER-3 / ATCC MYA-2586) TaxID=559297 RepID=A0ABX2VY33_AJEDR|nr:uncharacterized protein BDCG_17357 [Blastomyces dermatitidis ER-3]OAT02059.1 hypothetical protein BDCG_17357 [Blastomyces dermatitidis ER-3]
MIRMMKKSLISLEHCLSVKIHNTTLHEHDSLKTLDSDQCLLHDTILYHYTEILNDESLNPLLINLDSEDGTGKTYLIMILSITLQNLAEAQDLSTSIIQAMLTDVAAHFINA